MIIFLLEKLNNKQKGVFLTGQKMHSLDMVWEKIKTPAMREAKISPRVLIIKSGAIQELHQILSIVFPANL